MGRFCRRLSQREIQFTRLPWQDDSLRWPSLSRALSAQNSGAFDGRRQRLMLKTRKGFPDRLGG